MTQEEKRVIAPMINVNHNGDETGLKIRVDLAGASKESVDLDVGDKGYITVPFEDTLRGHKVVIQ
jgi:HSP20 family molecular chaperone IbpA